MIINKLNISFRAACVTLSLVAASASAVPASAQEKVSDILSMIEQNNTELQALRKRAESEQYGYKAERALDAPEIGFDYLWGSPADIGTRKDVSVSQSVDLAALTGARGKLATSKTALSDASTASTASVSCLRPRVCISTLYIAMPWLPNCLRGLPVPRKSRRLTVICSCAERRT